MKIFFSCSTKKLIRFLPYHRLIRQELISNSITLLHDWLEQTVKEIKLGIKRRNLKLIYKNTLKAIENSDACVFENTVAGFSVAYHINYALLRKKPTLVLILKTANSTFKDSFIEAVESPYLTVKYYNKNNLKKIINNFLGISKIEYGQKRYNVVLENKQRYYLDWASNEYQKSRSKIIRDALNKCMEEDKNFKK